MKLIKIFLIAALVVLTGTKCFSQSVSVSADTVKISQVDPGSEEAKQNQNQNRNQNGNDDQVKQKKNAQNQETAKAVKKVKGAKPDMSKSKGARPNIVRPAGSGIPKGVGKPGGAGRRGGR